MPAKRQGRHGTCGNDAADLYKGNVGRACCQGSNRSGGAGKDFKAGDALAKHCWVRRRQGLAQGRGTKDRPRGLQGPRYSEQREGRLERVHVFTVPKDLESIS